MLENGELHASSKMSVFEVVHWCIGTEFSQA